MIRYANPRVEGANTDFAQLQASNFAELVDLELRPQTALQQIEAYDKNLHRSIVLCWGSEELQTRMCEHLLGVTQDPLPRKVAQALMVISNEHATKFGFDVTL